MVLVFAFAYTKTSLVSGHQAMKRLVISPAAIAATPITLATAGRSMKPPLLALVAAFSFSQPAMADDSDWHIENTDGKTCVSVEVIRAERLTQEEVNRRVQMSSEQLGIYNDPQYGPRIIAINKAKCMEMLTRMRGPKSQAQIQQDAEIFAEAVAEYKKKNTPVQNTQKSPDDLRWQTVDSGTRDCVPMLIVLDGGTTKITTPAGLKQDILQRGEDRFMKVETLGTDIASLVDKSTGSIVQFIRGKAKCEKYVAGLRAVDEDLTQKQRR